ncbi:putative RING finger protein [Operophtera brumata]|uniref:Putative RING finger protein n=1 Tax=Operophtera brumata TaxID=104452 RepID=A0A0L7KHU3_OPEBR|nr:putative RING finger protein [Operophtera brumata]
MPCESCAVQFSVFKRKRVCYECERYYCSGCLRRGGGAMCAPCRVLATRPLSRSSIAHLKVRDLQCFLQRQNVSTRGCVGQYPP